MDGCSILVKSKFNKLLLNNAYANYDWFSLSEQYALVKAIKNFIKFFKRIKNHMVDWKDVLLFIVKKLDKNDWNIFKTHFNSMIHSINSDGCLSLLRKTVKINFDLNIKKLYFQRGKI